MTSVGDPLVGQVLDGRYRILSRLARGGMATVYQAVDTRLTRTVAVKVMHVGLGDDAEFARKFDREARAAARLSHPNVVAVFDQGQAVLDGHTVRPYIVMEYVEGPTLRDLIVRDAPLPPLRALEVLEPVLGALAAAHDAGLVHRDVKPENVLISERGQIKVADFGLAKAVSSQTSTATQGLLIGTVSYLPPELVLSGRADARSDVYSAGVVLFELLTGRKPHTGETPIQVAYAHVHNDVPAPSAVVGSGGHGGGPIPPYLDALVTGATARDAAARPHDARVLLAQLRRVRSALLAGLAEDPELTQDLSSVRAGAVAGTARLAAPRPGTPSPAAERTAQTVPGPPTVRDAPPPVTPRPRASGAHPLSPESTTAQQERQRRRRHRGVAVLLLVLLATVVVAVGAYHLTEGRFTTAPALTSLGRAEAERVADRAGLRLRVEEAYSETVPRGRVIGTEPGAGGRVLDGGELAATLSRGAERVTVPTLVGLSEAAATSALGDARLATGRVKDVWSDTVPTGRVVRASARAGARLAPTTAVALTVSRGREPVAVTDHTGRSAAAAAEALERDGFAVVQRTAHSAGVAAGLVLRQTPDSGRGAAGDTVTLTRSLGPVLVTVPNVRAMEVRAAAQVMADAGFSTRVRRAADGDGLGFVVATGPRIRSEVPRGSTITLYVV